MATYHLRVKTISRGQGQSAVAAAAYRSGERLTDGATGRIRDYGDRAGRVRFAGVFLPFGAPAWARDRAALWNAVERVECRHDATLAREIELSLPHELTDVQRLQLVRDFCRENLMRRGLVVDVAIHAPEADKGRGGDPRNHHAHLLIAERPLGPGGFAARKDRGLQHKATLYGWRANWATLCNRYLAAHGHAARVDHRSFRARGITDRQPTVSIGPKAFAMQRRGIVTPQGQRLATIKARNALRQGWTGARSEVGRATPAGAAAGPGTGFKAAASGLVAVPPYHQRQAGPLSAAAPATRSPTGAAAGIGLQLGQRLDELYRTEQNGLGLPIRDAPLQGYRSAGTGPPFWAASGVVTVPPPFRPPEVAAMPAIAASPAGTLGAGVGAGFRAAASNLSGTGPPPFRPPRLSGAAIGRAFASLAAVAPERGAIDAARELCSRGPLVSDRDPSPGAGAGCAPMIDSVGDAEPCSYEAEAAAIVRRYAREIDAIRQTVMPRWMMEAAIRAVRDAQRAALVTMRERRRWRSKHPRGLN